MGKVSVGRGREEACGGESETGGRWEWQSSTRHTRGVAGGFLVVHRIPWQPFLFHGNPGALGSIGLCCPFLELKGCFIVDNK